MAVLPPNPQKNREKREGFYETNYSFLWKLLHR